jgi:hypothetical protein
MWEAHIWESDQRKNGKKAFAGFSHQGFKHYEAIMTSHRFCLTGPIAELTCSQRERDALCRIDPLLE